MPFAPVQVDTAAVATALAVDNVLGLLYFPFCGYLCRFAHEGRDKDEGGTTGEFSGGGMIRDNDKRTLVMWPRREYYGN